MRNVSIIILDTLVKYMLKLSHLPQAVNYQVNDDGSMATLYISERGGADGMNPAGRMTSGICYKACEQALPHALAIMGTHKLLCGAYCGSERGLTPQRLLAFSLRRSSRPQAS